MRSRLFVLAIGLIMCLATVAQEPVAKPTQPTEVEKLKQQVKDLTLQNEYAQIQTLTLQMQQLNLNYSQLVQKMQAENPGMVWNPQAMRLVPQPKPAPASAKTEAPKPAPARVEIPKPAGSPALKK